MNSETTRFVSQVFVVCAMGVASVLRAQALPTGSDRATAQVYALEQQLKVEFLAAGNATRERLDQEAAGDHLAAQRAERIAQGHRHRFLELKRDIARLTVAIAPSVAAARNPFAPDASFVAFAASSSENRVLSIASAALGERSFGTIARSAWDLYRAHAGPSVATSADPADSAPASVKPQGDAARTWGMYGHAAPSRTSGEMRSRAEPTSVASSISEATPEVREPPSQPFFVYRDPQGPPTSR